MADGHPSGGYTAVRRGGSFFPVVDRSVRDDLPCFAFDYAVELARVIRRQERIAKQRAANPALYGPPGPG